MAFTAQFIWTQVYYLLKMSILAVRHFLKLEQFFGKRLVGSGFELGLGLVGIRSKISMARTLTVQMERRNLTLRNKEI